MAFIPKFHALYFDKKNIDLKLHKFLQRVASACRSTLVSEARSCFTYLRRSYVSHE